MPVDKVIRFAVLLLFLSLLTVGCRRAGEFRLIDELKPTTERDLIEMPEEDLERVDIARMNIICARAAFQGKGPDLDDCLRQIDAWAEQVKRAEERY